MNAVTTETTDSTKAPKVKTVADNMPARSVFATPVEAAAFLTRLGGELTDFASTPFIAPGIGYDEDTESVTFDPAIYAENTETHIVKLTTKGDGSTSVRAIVTYAAPTLESFIANDAGLAWVRGIIRKEANHVAVRALRAAVDLTAAIDRIPTTLDGFITGSRESTSYESFDEIYKDLNDFMAERSAAWKRRAFKKANLRMAFESKGYALAMFSELEDRGEDKISAFVFALNMAIKTCEASGRDPQVFKNWLETRDSKAYAVEAEAADDLFENADFDSLATALLAKPTEATEAEAKPADADPAATA